jgi:tetratricopeptide (TPR) repeat protein
MLIKRYIVEGYEDIIHCFGYFCHTHIFVEKYNFIISMEDNEIKYLCESDKPQNKYHIFESGFKEKESVIEEVEIDDNFIEMCYKMFQKEKEVKNIKETIQKNFNIIDFSYNDKSLFKAGIKHYGNKDYDKAIDTFNKVTNITNNKNIKAHSLYNISCCYSQMNDYEKSIQMLKQAFESGYIDWKHIMSDPDFDNIRNSKNSDFDNIIKNMATVYSDKKGNVYCE